ncbi:MAG: orotidine-5'-phosphate decarboxylase [Thermomonas sp.]
MTFIERLRNRWQAANSLVCVGLDPDPAKFPDAFVDDEDALFAFCRDIADATAEFACAFKPQIAYFAARNDGEAALQRLVAHINGTHPEIPVILDAKRGDIGSTAEQYATEAFERFGADAVTLNPYMGRDSAAPFLQYNDRGCVFLCHTSNPGARDFQELDVGGEPLYQRIARTIAGEWNAGGNCALVVGATFPEELKTIRGIVGDMPLLIPGVGAQGGDVEAVVRNGKAADGTGLVINSSRGILYASNGADYADAAANAAKSLRDEINRYR